MLLERVEKHEHRITIIKHSTLILHLLNRSFSCANIDPYLYKAPLSRTI